MRVFLSLAADLICANGISRTSISLGEATFDWCNSNSPSARSFHCPQSHQPASPVLCQFRCCSYKLRFTFTLPSHSPLLVLLLGFFSLSSFTLFCLFGCVSNIAVLTDIINLILVYFMFAANTTCQATHNQKVADSLPQQKFPSIRLLNSSLCLDQILPYFPDCELLSSLRKC